MIKPEDILGVQPMTSPTPKIHNLLKFRYSFTYFYYVEVKNHKVIFHGMKSLTSEERKKIFDALRNIHIVYFHGDSKKFTIKTNEEGIFYLKLLDILQ